MVAVSAAVTFWRFAGFFPFASDRILEWAVNAHGVTSGGAFMSVLFTALNYLTAFAFFLIFLRTDRTRAFLLKSLSAFGAGALLSCAFGFVQLAGNLKLGNNPLSIVNEIINATFKDAISFGCFLSMIIPLSIGAVLSRRGPKRAAAAALAASAVVLILAAGSKSAFFGALAGLACFLALAAATAFRRRRESGAGSPGRRPARRLAVLVLAGLIAAAGAGVLAVEVRRASGRSFRCGLSNGFRGRKRSSPMRVNTLWRLAGDCVEASPLTGVGIGAYIIESSNFTARDGGSLKDLPDSAENYFLQAAAELGLTGLAVFLWFFWEIFRKARSAWRSAPPRSPDRWLLAGAISGLVAYAVNTLTHSYIGSFEIKYAFWFFVAAVFILGRPDYPAGAGRARRSSGPDPARPDRGGDGGHPLRRGPSLDFDPRTVARPGHGHVPHPARSRRGEGREDGRRKRVPLDPRIRRPSGPSREPVARRPAPRLASRHRDERRPRQDLARARRLPPGADDQGSRPVQPEWQEIVLDVPAEDVGRSRILFFEVGRTWNPSKTTGAPDSRNLGVAVGPIRFQ